MWVTQGWRWWWGLKAVFILCSFSQLEAFVRCTWKSCPSNQGFHAFALKMPLIGLSKVLLSEMRSQDSGWVTQGDSGWIFQENSRYTMKGHLCFWCKLEGGLGRQRGERAWESGGLTSSSKFVMTSWIHSYSFIHSFIHSFVQQLLMLTSLLVLSKQTNKSSCLLCGVQSLCVFLRPGPSFPCLCGDGLAGAEVLGGFLQVGALGLRA